MKRVYTLFLKVAVILIGTVVLAGLIRFPQTEGRAANLDLISIYKDPLIIYISISSIPFFVGLYQAFKLLGYVDTNKLFSDLGVYAVRTIKYCATITAFLIVMAILYIRLTVVDDDPAGVTAVGIVTTFISLVIAIGANSFQKFLKKFEDL